MKRPTLHLPRPLRHLLLRLRRLAEPLSEQEERAADAPPGITALDPDVVIILEHFRG